MNRIWLEAESFDTLGGWVIDCQSIEQMGSAYVMAHGMGTPVRDAETVLTVPGKGRYTVWVRTRDWSATWKRGTPAGRFNVIVNGETLPETLGTNGPDWSWQKAGAIDLDAKEATIALHDLTGFNGRCDALFLTDNPNDAPPDDAQALETLRHELACVEMHDDPHEFDFVVCGGGVAGVCAAVAALRSGAKVALLHDRPVLGGANSSEIRVSMGGVTHVGIYPRLGNVVREIAPAFGGNGTYEGEVYEDSRKANIFRHHPPENYHLGLNECVVAVERDGNTITAVVTRNVRTGERRRYFGRVFADCTGNAAVARMMGAATRMGRESRSEFGEDLAPDKADKQVMGLSVQWISRQTPEATKFPDIDWGIEFSEDTCYHIFSGDWEWETGQYRDQVNETEDIRDYGLMVTYANWSFLKNRSRRKDEYARRELAWVSPLGGKRETCRVVGDYILTQNDIENNTIHEDATAAITWNFDLHFPDPENAGKFAEPFRSCAYHRGIPTPYPVPFRCLYARDVRNLLLGGRHISMTHVAFASVRVMRVLGMLGEVIGLSAGICAQKNITPRELYQRHLDELKQKLIAGVPPAPLYHSGGGNCDSEMYHFKELGKVKIFPRLDEDKFADPAIAQRISQLNVSHKKR